MKAQRIMGILLAALLLGGAAVWYIAPLNASEQARVDSSTTAADTESEVQDRIIVYYFHGTRRCNTCRTIEASAREAVEDKYGEQLKSGLLIWKVVNTDEAENEHFIEDFGLVSSSLVVVEFHDGRVVRHSVLQDAWLLIRDKPRFIEYVQRSIGEYLKP